MAGIRRSVLALGAAVVLTAGAGNVALADHIRVSADISVGPAQKVEQGYTLNVRLRTSDGKPLNDTIVRFYEVVELFGRREMYLMSARTDGQGIVSTTYLPARPGRHELIVRCAGTDHRAALETTFAFDATVTAPPYRAATVPLASFTALVPYGVGIVVLSVWALISFAFLGTALGIRRGRRDQQDIA